MRAAAELDDATEKHPVTPGAILPAREQLGELLLELKQPAASLEEFETSLRSAPNRFNGLCGAARAARFAADQNKLAADRKSARIDYAKRAKTYYEKLLVVSRHAAGTRPEIEEAKAFLTGVNVKNSASTKWAMPPLHARERLQLANLRRRCRARRECRGACSTISFLMKKRFVSLACHPSLFAI